MGCDELGPARLFVANSDENSVRIYVHDVLGPLLAGGSAMHALLQTLQAFFESGRSVRLDGALDAVRLGDRRKPRRRRSSRGPMALQLR